MRTVSILRLLAASWFLSIAGLCVGQPAKSEIGPLVLPAVRANHADRAMVLASARAGSRIVAVGDHGIVLLSDDGGKTHRQARSVPIDLALTSVFFVDEKRGWAVGHGGVVLRTADGGETWVLQRKDTKVDRPLFAVHFFDADHGVAVGLWSLVLVTSDGGVSWQSIEMPLPEGARKADLNLLNLFADAKGRIFAAAEKGMVLRSDDRGQHWSYSATGYKGSFWTGVATSNGTLLLAGLRGSLYRSIDDGRTWVRIDTGSKSSIAALAVNGPQIIGVGMDGLVLLSNDDGATFKSQVRADRISLTTVTVNAVGQPVMYQTQGVVRAGDESPRQ